MRDLEKFNKHIEEDVIVNREYPTSPRFNDISGKTFGRLKVLSYAGKDEHNEKFYLCKCECGNTVYARYMSITRGRTVSCGCRHKEVLIQRAKDMCKHGKANSRLYRIYQSMLNSCISTKPNCKHTYMDNNINVCDEWLSKTDGFNNFYKWAYEEAEPRYTDYYEEHPKVKININRIDFNKGFSPDNCRFCITKVVANNTRRNIYKRYKNYVFSLSIWADILGMPYIELKYRHRRYWTDFELLTTPYDPNKLGTTRVPEPDESIIPKIADEYLVYNKYDEFCKMGIIDPEWSRYKSFDKVFDEIPTGTYTAKGTIRSIEL